MSAWLSDAEQQQLIVTEVGDYQGIVAANIDLLWSFYAPYSLFPPLQYLLTKRHAMTMLAGQVWQAVDAVVDDTRQSLSDLHKALMDGIAALDKEITGQMNAVLGMAGLGVRSGAIVTVAPTTPPVGYPDANDPRYLGSPYLPISRLGR